MPQNRKIIMPWEGDLVKSTSGRDRHRVFLVIAIDETNKIAPIVISDGKKHPISERKHKNPRHLKVIRGSGKMDIKCEMSELNDVQVYEICQKYDF